MSDLTSSSDVEKLASLNAQVSAAERDLDAKVLSTVLGENFRFRRADPAGTVVDRDQFLTALADPGNRNDLLTSVIESIDVRGAQAVVVAMVTFSGLRNSKPTSGLFRNIRLFDRTGDGWRLVMWFNKRVGDLPADT
jgi:hypothetical protein